MRRVVLSALLSGVLACGGRVEDPTSGGFGGSDPTPVSSGHGGAKSSPSDGLPTHELGECKPGFDRASNPARACNWLTDSGLCFETNDEACACICPQDKNSLCYSPFYNGAGSATPVHCQ